VHAAAGRAAPTLLPTTPPAWFFTTLIAMVALAVAVPGPRWLAAPWTLLGLIPIAAGVALHAWAIAAFARAATTPDPEGRPSALVRSGPYALSRNPRYLAGTPILLGVAALLGATTPVLALPLYWLAASRWVAREEARLGKRVGAEWAAYTAAVRRWI
jgi:protein-S-isoprenylcysteine O-methyltransferase Ste14